MSNKNKISFNITLSREEVEYLGIRPEIMISGSSIEKRVAHSMAKDRIHDLLAEPPSARIRETIKCQNQIKNRLSYPAYENIVKDDIY